MFQQWCPIRGWPFIIVAIFLSFAIFRPISLSHIARCKILSCLLILVDIYRNISRRSLLIEIFRCWLIWMSCFSYFPLSAVSSSILIIALFEIVIIIKAIAIFIALIFTFLRNDMIIVFAIILSNESLRCAFFLLFTMNLRSMSSLRLRLLEHSRRVKVIKCIELHFSRIESVSTLAFDTFRSLDLIIVDLRQRVLSIFLY